MILAVVPAGASVSCRVVVSSDPFPLTVTTVSATITGITGIIENQPVSAQPTPAIIYGAAAPTQHASGGNDNLTGASTSFSLVVTAGDIILVAAGAVGAAISSVSDGVNSYTPQNSGSSPIYNALYTATASTSTTLTVTVTATGAAQIYAVGASYTGAAIDQIGTFALSSSNSVSVSATASQVGDSIFVWGVGNNSVTGFSVPTLKLEGLVGEGNGNGIGAGLQTVTVTANISTQTGGQAVTIKATSPPAPVAATGTSLDVAVTALPALPAGSNAIGTVGVTSLPALPAGSNSIGTVVLGAGSAAVGTVKMAPLATLGVTDSFAPTSIAAATAETVQGTAGGVAVVIGTRVFFALSCAGADDAVTAVSGAFVYVAMKGVTSGRYYAMAQYGEALQGQFDAPQSENVEIVVRNSLVTGAVVMHGAFWSMSP